MLTSSEKYELNKKFRILQSQICNKANLVDGKIPVEELPILQEIIDALNAANTPSGDNPFATMDDLGALDVGTYITVVANYSALPAANLHTGEFYWLENSQGTAWLPGTLGGTFYNKGLYYSNGTTWVATEAPYQATQAEVNTGLVNDRFVTPYTFENASKWTTKQDVLTNPVTGTGTSGQVSYWTGTATQGGSANLFWDAVNNRLGVGTNAPGFTLTVIGNANIKNASSELIINNSTYTEINYGVNNYFRANGTAAIITGPLIQFRLTSEIARFSSIGNLLLNSTTDNGQRLQVYGSTLLRGSGTTSSTTALLVQNSASTELFKVTDDGKVAAQGIGGYTTATFVIDSNLAAVAGNYIVLQNNNVNITTTSSITNHIIARSTYAPTSGTGVFNNLAIQYIINQTGGANGITRGLYVNPTLTAAADWRSIEWSNNTGWGLYGAGTADNYFAGRLSIGTTFQSQGIRIGRNPTAADSRSMFVNVNIQNTVTSAYVAFSSSIGLNNSGFTLPSLSHFEALNDGTHTAGVVTNLYAFRENLGTYNATNVYGFYGNIAASTGRWNLYMNGTAANYINGVLTIGTTSPNASAKVQIDSNSQGFLPPRMTTTERNAITTPAAGLVIFNTTTTKLECYDGAVWQAAW